MKSLAFVFGILCGSSGFFRFGRIIRIERTRCNHYRHNYETYNALD